jgi:hypothetical protein
MDPEAQNMWIRWIRIRNTEKKSAFSLWLNMRGMCVMLQNSTASRVMYGFLLLVTVVISCIMLAPGVQVNQLFYSIFSFFVNYGSTVLDPEEFVKKF